MSATPLAAALQQFEVAEANLVKLEAIWKELSVLTPDGIAFGTNPEYEDRCRAFVSIMTALPKIDGWKPEDLPADLDEIAQWRLDAKEIGEFNAEVTVEKAIEDTRKGH